ncbi:MAG: hypothetical protein HYY49_03855 [Ignavibacteriales bacterium]|nr:hypothetical protein [Ignavibacteriales bacterium]
MAIPTHYPRLNLDEFQVMPNHVHGIIVIRTMGHVGARHAVDIHACRGLINQTPTWPLMKDPRISLGKIIRHFKARASKKMHDGGHYFFQWQRNFHDRIIRNHKELENVRKYIRENPANWQRDENNPLKIQILST